MPVLRQSGGGIRISMSFCGTTCAAFAEELSWPALAENNPS